MIVPPTHFYNMHTARRQGEAKSSNIGCAKTEEWLRLDVTNPDKKIYKPNGQALANAKSLNHNKIIEFVQSYKL